MRLEVSMSTERFAYMAGAAIFRVQLYRREVHDILCLKRRFIGQSRSDDMIGMEHVN